MTIFYLCPGLPDCISGGTRKLYDHVALLNANGLDARIVPTHEIGTINWDYDRDVMVVPEVYGDGIRDYVPGGWRRIAFVQNSYITDHVDGTQIVHRPNGGHPYTTTPELIAIFTESQHTEDRLRERFGDSIPPLIRTHSSGNGRRGEDAGFFYGKWPRERRVCYFGYKHGADNAAVLDGLELPKGWTVETMTGMTDEEIAVELRTAAIFMATNREEGMCAPTSEAIISGAVNVCWTGGGPDEYLRDPIENRAMIAEQDNVEHLRSLLVATAADIDRYPKDWASRTRKWSEWFQTTYSRKREIREIVDIFETLL